MRKFLWPVRTGIVALAFLLLPADADDGRLSGSVLCASESDDCKYELDSYCSEGTVVRVDYAPKGTG